MTVNSEIYFIGLAILIFLIITFLFIRKISNDGNLKVKIEKGQDPSDLNISDGSQVEKYSWINGDGCVTVEEIKIINGGHDWPSPLSFWANQDINANTEIWNFVSKYNINGLIDCDNLSI